MKMFNKYLPALAVLALPAQAFADQTGAFGSMGYAMGYGGWFFGPLMMIVLFGLIIAALFGVIRLFGAGDSSQHTSAANILAERFASGEIDEAEHAARRSKADHIPQARPAPARYGGRTPPFYGAYTCSPNP